ncbi:1-acyl-sn-glycerol-3-phosphate acyltransferase [Dysgonomonas sp. 520]|uniref:1-acyl-sn-glycerol-3-phosphate acyltransferase n=1 Tax=Dysgonomonas sp. 520 TaxID=2302931 RepID=UPI0013D32E31|nr:1-acyl-sn-glycerol-3-phosphate acyltransferase [Dysgonomonas sp. 520]NDW10878.1 glycerol acyltransferase [Dysgonomonas sp. 520]
MNNTPIELIDLDKVIQSKSPQLYKKTPKFLINYLKRKIHQDEINEILIRYGHTDGVDFMVNTTNYFGLTLNVSGLDRISTDGRYIFASNHPLGGLDGICLSSIIGEKFDKKIKYIVNDLLLNIKPLQSIFVPVNKHGSQNKKSISAQNEAFESDNQIVTFPAGICSRKIDGKIQDLEWKKTFISKAVETKRDIVPVFFDGRNSNFFYRFANIRKSLGIKFNIEMLFLPDELFKNRNETFNVIFGKPIPYSFFDKSKTQYQWAQYVREEVYKLGQK